MIAELQEDWTPDEARLRGNQHDEVRELPQAGQESPQDRDEDNNKYTFDKDTETSSIADCIRIFDCPIETVRDEDENNDGNQRTNDLNYTTVRIGSIQRENNDDQDPIAGGCAYYGPNDRRNFNFCVGGSARDAALLAILYVMQISDLKTEMSIIIPSKHLAKDLTSRLNEHEDKNWVGYESKTLIMSVVAQLYMRLGKTSFKVEKPTPRRKSEPQELAEKGLSHCMIELDNSVNDGIKGHLTGAKLSTLTQSTAYQLIRDTHPAPRRQTTLQNLDIARWAFAERSGRLPQANEIWKSLNNKVVRKPVQVFLWRTVHNAYKIGQYWDHIPNYEHRGNCPICNVPETMEHILLECNALERQIIWNLTRELWLRKNQSWPEPSMGTILSSCLPMVKNNTETRGANRALQILIPETAFLIWKMRCERRIEREDDAERAFSANSVESRWNTIMNERLQHDRILTNQSRFGPRALKESVVLDTWDGIVEASEGESLPENWIQTPGVLVGKQPHRRGRNR